LAREKRQQDILTVATEQLPKEVLGPPSEEKAVSESEMKFLRKE
jgi:hypothetical protein